MNVKLIIWDLDDTLWQGSLSEDQQVIPISHRIDLIHNLNQHGILSSLCSKNNHHQAQKKLVELGIWEEFVFPCITQAPKAPIIKQLIEDIQLRAENILFVDDNIHNLEEAKFLIPSINVLNALSPDCDDILSKILSTNLHIYKNRIQEYRILETKLYDKKNSKLSNEEFLKACDIRVCLMHRMDNLDFSARIEELINRSNQLNYTHSRVENNSIALAIAQILEFDCFSIFAWDKYGYYGLIGFVMVEKGTKLIHFVFSCRIMHMGIESWVLSYLIKSFPTLKTQQLISLIDDTPWITQEDFYSPSIRNYIFREEAILRDIDPQIRIMANCQSGAIAHFSGLHQITIFDNAPQIFDPQIKNSRVFYLRSFLTDEYQEQYYPKTLIYGAFVDYGNGYWPNISDEELDAWAYKTCVTRFSQFAESHKKRVLVIIPTTDAPDDKFPLHFGVTRERVESFNSFWIEQQVLHPNIHILEVGKLAKEEELIDVRHYDVSLLKKIADYTREWFYNNQPGD